MTKYMDGAKIEREERKRGRREFLEHFGRYKVAAGMTVADYVELREFYKKTASSGNGLSLIPAVRP